MAEGRKIAKGKEEEIRKQSEERKRASTVEASELLTTNKVEEKR